MIQDEIVAQRDRPETMMKLNAGKDPKDDNNSEDSDDSYCKIGRSMSNIPD